MQLDASRPKCMPVGVRSSEGLGLTSLSSTLVGEAVFQTDVVVDEVSPTAEGAQWLAEWIELLPPVRAVEDVD